jgi:hypothetical protein
MMFCLKFALPQHTVRGRQANRLTGMPPARFRCAGGSPKCKQTLSISGFSRMPARKRRQDKCRLQATARKALQLGDVQPITTVI